MKDSGSLQGVNIDNMCRHRIGVQGPFSLLRLIDTCSVDVQNRYMNSVFRFSTTCITFFHSCLLIEGGHLTNHIQCTCIILYSVQCRISPVPSFRINTNIDPVILLNHTEMDDRDNSDILYSATKVFFFIITLEK